MATLPIALAVAGAAAAVAGAGVSAYGAYNTAQASQSNAKFQEKLAGYNQNLATQQAADAEARGKLDEEQARRRNAAIIGSESAGIAATGVDPGSGSARDLLVDTAGLGEFDIQTVRENTKRAAYEAQLRGWNAGATGSLEGAQARSISPGLGATTSLLAGAGSVADRWYMYSRTNSGNTTSPY